MLDSKNAFPPRWRQLDALPVALYTAKQVKELDRLAVDSGVSGIELMMKAAQAAWLVLIRRWPLVHQLQVFCGTGNNGGDGYLLAKLALEEGVNVQLVEVSSRGREGLLQGDAARAREQLLELVDEYQQQLTVIDFDCLDGSAPAVSLVGAGDAKLLTDVIVDALLGTGLKGEVRSNYLAAIECINCSSAPVLALDIPSGIDSDTGSVGGTKAVRAEVTVSFIGMKCGLLTGDAVDYCGDLTFAALQIDQAVYQSVASQAKRLQLEACVKFLPRRQNSAYKNQSGHLLVIGGDRGMAGAAVLAAAAALRCGTGLITVATRAEHVATVVTRHPELMAVPVESAAALDEALARCTAVVIGPGLGTDTWGQQMLQRLTACSKPMVIDADALNLIASTPALLPAAPVVFTPHSGEAARLMSGLDAAEVTYSGRNVNQDRIGTGKVLLSKIASMIPAFDHALVLKGAGTVVLAQTDGLNVAAKPALSVCPYGNAAMATAGMGDVLCGVIGALLAQGLAVRTAAEVGVCMHAAAGDYEAYKNGGWGMSASDIPNSIRALVLQLPSQSTAATLSS